MRWIDRAGWIEQPKGDGLMLVYIAGPIDTPISLSKALSNWRDLVYVELQRHGFTCYRPDLAFTYDPAVDSGHDGQSIILANEQILSVSDVLLANLDFRSVGTVREVQMALSLGIPVVARPSNATQSPYARDTRIIWVDKVEDAVAVIMDMSKSSYGDSFDHRVPMPRSALDTPPLLISLTDEATPPRRAYPTSAGLDLVVSKAVTIGPEDFTLIPTGVSVAIPAGYVGIIRGRSSAWFTRKLMVFEGTVDAEYRGELFVGVRNMLKVEHKVEKGDRLAQLIIMRIYTPRIEVVGKLDETKRGVKGFGSTGR